MKTVIYGRGRFQQDFEYIFQDLKIDYYIDDKNVDEANGIFPTEQIRQELENTLKIILCGENREQQRRRLEQLGYCHGKDFIDGEEMFPELNGDYFMEASQLPPEIVMWGTGKVSEIFRKRYPEIKIKYYIDSNIQKRNTQLEGVKILAPEDIQDWNACFIVIAVNMCDEICNYLNAKGLESNKNYVKYEQIDCPPSEMMRMVTSAEPKKVTPCRSMFHECFVEQGGVTYCCCPYWISDVNIGNLWENDFSEVWNSVKARIIRLSAANSTYCFCQPQFCGKLKAADEVLTDYSLEPDDKLAKLMLSFDDACNLCCPSCRKEYHFNRKQGCEQLRIDTCAEKLLNVIPYVDSLFIAGNGDPFYCNSYRKIWQRPSATGQKGKKIVLQTNGTLFNETNWNEIEKNYEHIAVKFSIDSVKKETFEKLRKGARWEIVWNNLQFASQLKKEGRLECFEFQCVVQRDNYGELPDLVEKAIELGVDKVIFLRICNFNIYSEEEFSLLSMYAPNGKMKPELRNILELPIMKNDIVDLFNLKEQELQ